MMNKIKTVYLPTLRDRDKAWDIYEVPGTDANLYVDGKQCRGVTRYFNREICINKDLLPCDKRQVLIHELTHAFIYDTQIETRDDYTEEHLCDFMAMYADDIIAAVDLVLSP